MNRREPTREEQMQHRMPGDRFPDGMCTVCDVPLFDFYEERGVKDNLIICDVCGHVIRWSCATLGHVAITGKRLRAAALADGPRSDAGGKK